MPTEIDTGASPADTAATTDNAAPDTSAAQAAGESAVAPPDAAVSGTPNDEIARLDRELDDNVLKAREPEDDEPEPPEKPEPEKVDEPEEPVAEAEAVEADPLAEQTKPRTLEDLKKQFPRAQTVALEEIAKVEAESWNLKTEFESIGGTVGVEIAKSVIPALLNANPGEKDSDAVFNSITETNPALGLAMSRALLFHAIEEEAPDPKTGLPTNIATGNALIKTRWANLDVEKIDRLNKYEEAGLLDHEELAKEAELYKGDSEAVKTLKAEVAELKQGKEQEKVEADNKARIKANEHHEKATSYVSKQVMDAVIPIAEHYGWTATKEELNSKDPAVKQLAEGKIAMGKMLTAYINDRIRQLPEWASVEHLGKTEQAFTEDGQVRHLFTSNSEPLVNKIVAEFKAMVRVLNPTFAKSFGSTRAAQLKAKTARSDVPTEIPAVKKTEENGKKGDFNTAIADLDKQYDSEMKQVRA